MVNGRKFNSIASSIRKAEELGMFPALSYNRISDLVQDEGNSRVYHEQSAKRYAEKSNLFIVDVFNII